MKKVCSACGDMVLSLIPAKGHTDGKWFMTVIPTRNSVGTIECHCADCDEVTRSVAMSYYAATYIKYKVNINPEANTAAQVSDAVAMSGHIISMVKNGAMMADGEKVGTGCEIYYSHLASYKLTEVDTVILYGDLDGDGIIGIDDYAKMSAYVMGNTSVLADGSAFRRAADLNNDGEVDAFDLALLDLQMSSSRAIDQSTPQY